MVKEKETQFFTTYVSFPSAAFSMSLNFVSVVSRQICRLFCFVFPPPIGCLFSFEVDEFHNDVHVVNNVSLYNYWRRDY